MKKYIILVLFILPLQLFSQNSFNYSGGFDLHLLGLGFTSYDSDIADKYGFKSTTVPLEFRFDGFFKKYFIAGIDVTLGFPKDLEPFHNTVTGGARVKSSVTIPQTSLFTGLKTNPFGKSNKKITGLLLIGYDWIGNARRGIDNCADCTKHEFDLKSGFYLTPEINYEYFSGDNDFPMAIGLALGYKYFFGGDIKSSIILSTYFRRYN